MQAIILAAGMGTRFGKMTESIPKGMIPVKWKAYDYPINR